jgi:hypothetical protein
MESAAKNHEVFFISFLPKIDRRTVLPVVGCGPVSYSCGHGR